MTQQAGFSRSGPHVTALEQHLPAVTVGASYGAALLAARAGGEVDTDAWNPVHDRVQPDPALAVRYDQLYDLYRNLYPATSETAHALARFANASSIP